MARWKQVLTRPEQVRALIGEPRESQLTKVLSSLDQHCRAWIERSPFIVLCSAGADGRLDASPKGDPGGFVKIVDDRTLAIPDRPGNRRADTFMNLLHNPQVAVIFLMPGRGETLRVTGKASIVLDEELLQEMVVNKRAPQAALVIDIEEIMFHCGKSMIRSKLWQPEHWPSIDGLASYAQFIADQSVTDETVEQMEARFGTWKHGKELY
ncbi:MAG: pyridoxamine 5'-phosphate oxidase family protein [Pseudomonadota bacterium]